MQSSQSMQECMPAPSQEQFFCTPDFITPADAQFSVEYGTGSQGLPMMRSPAALTPVRAKKKKKESLGELGELGPMQNEMRESLKEKNGSTPFHGAAMSSRTGFPSMGGIPNQKFRRVRSPPCIRNKFIRGQDVDQSSQPAINQVGSSSSRYKADFKEIKELGRGNFCKVFHVLHRLDGREYAIKRTIKKMVDDSQFRKAIQEVQALAAVGEHANIIRYYSAWVENHHLYIQLELCEQGSLADKLAAGHRFDEEELTQVMQQVAEGLAHMHQKGMVHLDIKPDNIYVHEGVYKIGDFGLANRYNGELSIEEGDARYQPGEILNDDYRNLPAADMFALGASIYELARGSTLPSSGPQYQAIRRRQLMLLPNFSASIQQTIKLLLHEDPKQRPTAESLLACDLFSRHGCGREVHFMEP